MTMSIPGSARGGSIITQESIHLRSLLEVARVVRSGAPVATVLDAIAREVGESFGFGLVVVNLHRPAWDDFEVAAVHGTDEARAAMLGQTLGRSYWEPLLDRRFEHHGAQLVPHEARDWDADEGTWFVPEAAVPERPDAWHPADALLLPLRTSGGDLLGILSLNEPASGRRPEANELAVLTAVAAHAAQAIESAQDAAATARHAHMLEHLFLVSSGLIRSDSVEAILRLVCDGVRAGLGFGRTVVELADREADRYQPVAAAGVDLEDERLRVPVAIGELDRIFDPAFEIEGCFLLPAADVERLVPAAAQLGGDAPVNGAGPLGWNGHSLFVPLYDRDGERTGFIWADNPADRLLPSRELLQTLRLFANQALTAIESAAQHEALRKAHEQQSALVESSPVGIVVLDAAGRVRSANKAAEEIFGWTHDELVGREPPWIPEHEVEAVRERVRGIVEGEPLRREAVNRRRDGTPVHVLISAAPLTVGTPGIVTTFVDVTERRRAERELERRHAELEALHETTLRLVDRLDFESVLGSLVERAGELVGTPHGYVYVVDEEREELVITLASGCFDAFLGTRLARGEGLSGRVWSENRPIAVDDYPAWEGRAHAFNDGPFGANVAVPLRVDDAVVGVLGLAYGEPGRRFGEAEIALLERFGRLASLALQNSRLYEEIRKSRELYRRVIETSSELIDLIGLDGRLLYASPSAEDQLGYTPDELIGIDYASLVHPDDLPGAREAIAQALAGDRPDPYICRVRHKDGRWRWFEGVPAPILDEDGEVELILAVSRDVTERMQREEELRESRELYRSVVENANDLIALFGLDGILTYASPSHRAVLGYEPDELVGMHARDLCHPDDLAGSERALCEVLDDLYTTFDLRIRHKEGHWVTLEGASKAIPGPDGSPRMILSTSRDVTEQRALEEQLRAAQKMEAIGQLAGGIAHDFNNLLTAIEGYGSLALAGLPEDSLSRSHVLGMKSAGERAAALTRQLLAFSRRQVLQPTVLGLDEIITGLEGMLRRLLGETIELVIEAAEDTGRVRADRGQLEQVAMNLAVNARDAMPRGGTLRIATANLELGEAFAELHDGGNPGPHVALTVSDTGEGMDRETLARIFDPFFTTKPVGEGTGLGLSTVYGIVKQTGGAIQVDSEPGAGTTFAVYLPRVWDDVQRDELPAPAALSGSATVLLVEDEPVVRDVVREMLLRAGYTVVDAGSGEEALAVADAHQGPIDALLTDVVMPGMSGPELAGELVAQRPGLRVLFASGYAEHAVASEGVLRPGTAFLEKPFTAAQLGAKLRETLSAPRAA